VYIRVLKVTLAYYEGRWMFQKVMKGREGMAWRKNRER
jgi:hypothetical protein